MPIVPPPEIEFDGTDMFVCYAGKRIAKRGYPGTPEAMTWISIEPGFVVTSLPDHSALAIQRRACPLTTRIDHRLMTCGNQSGRASAPRWSAFRAEHLRAERGDHGLGRLGAPKARGLTTNAHRRSWSRRGWN